MTTRRSPTMRRRRLGIELRQLRTHASLTIGQVAEALGCSDSRVSRIENGQVSATPQVVKQLLDLYEVTGERRDALMHVARVAQERGWWQAYSDALVVPLVGLEAAAASIRIYEALVVPGLFQTPSYAEAVIRRMRPDLPSEQIDRWVELRMTRQRSLFGRDDPPRLMAIIDEAVLHRQVGGLAAMGQQLRHLAEVAARSSVTLRVLPLATREHGAMSGPFTVFSFAESLDPDVVYLEHTVSDLYLEDQDEVRRYAQAFDELCQLALEPDASRACLAELAESRAPSSL